MNKFVNINVDVTAPPKWNSAKGIISSPDLRLMTDDDIVECSDEADGIIFARHFPRTNRQTKLREPSNTVVITFKSKIIPTHVYIGYERFSVATFIDNPLRCYICQEFGHSSKKCSTNIAKCAKCSSIEHTDCGVSEETL